ncbi:uncharacterized protein LOC136073131 [Hydra vulgaris]|uniref:uncharacterized protein LOC136073131 n=1 Tax=Hydra vulgaris TaxID=6087 RepID=UPI0032E9F7F7
MQAPASSGSLFYNYKKTHSIVLLAVCNAKYQFLLLDIGNSGRQSDGSVYANSQLGYAIENDLLHIPQACKVNGTETILPYVFVGDNAFGLKPQMMKPYPFCNLSYKKRLFNYRLSRVKRIVENAFDYCPNTYIDQDGPNELIPGESRKEIGDVQGLQDISSSACNNHSKDARKIRNNFKKYFNTDGAVDWQWSLINNTSYQKD